MCHETVKFGGSTWFSSPNTPARAPARFGAPETLAAHASVVAADALATNGDREPATGGPFAHRMLDAVAASIAGWLRAELGKDLDR